MRRSLRIGLARAPLAVGALDGEVAGAMGVEERRQHVAQEGVDEGGVTAREMGMAEVAADQAFLLSTKALSLERRGRDLVSSSTCSLRSTRATRWLMCCEPLSAWSPLTSKGNASISASSAGTGKRSESASTAATNSCCVTSSTRWTSRPPLLAVEAPLVDRVAPPEAWTPLWVRLAALANPDLGGLRLRHGIAPSPVPRAVAQTGQVAYS